MATGVLRAPGVEHWLDGGKERQNVVARQQLAPHFFASAYSIQSSSSSDGGQRQKEDDWPLEFSLRSDRGGC